MNAKNERERQRKTKSVIGGLGIMAAMLAVFMPTTQADGSGCQQTAEFIVEIGDVNVMDCVPDGSFDDADATLACTPAITSDGLSDFGFPSPVDTAPICAGSHTLFTATNTESKASGDESDFHCNGQRWYGSYQWAVKMEITPNSANANGGAYGAVHCGDHEGDDAGCNVNIVGNNNEVSCQNGPNDTEKGDGSCGITVSDGSVSFTVHLKCEDPPVPNGELPGLVIEKVYEVDSTGTVSLVWSTVQELLP
jgi:hypothetical protein